MGLLESPDTVIRFTILLLSLGMRMLTARVSYLSLPSHCAGGPCRVLLIPRKTGTPVTFFMFLQNSKKAGSDGSRPFESGEKSISPPLALGCCSQMASP